MWLRVGDWVQVRSKQEILATLDSKGRLDGLPFMPQMFKYCGRAFKVFKVAHKTCDTVNGTGGRRITHGIHLDVRCDGQAYGGCQAACLIFWKEAWLKPGVEEADAAESVPARNAPAASPDHRCSENDILKATSTRNGDEEIYQCQAVRLPYFTKLLPWWRLDQYVMDYASGNVTFRTIFNGLIYSAYCKATRAYNPTLGRPGRWLYDWFQSRRGGIPYPRHRGRLLPGQPGPVDNLDLQPGELVRIKSYREILSTLNFQNANRGLYFDGEMVPYCGGTYRVRARVTKFIDEKTAKMKLLKTPAIILENVWCRSCYSNNRMFCPRSIYSWWREVWLERIEEGSQPDPRALDAKSAISSTEIAKSAVTGSPANGRLRETSTIKSVRSHGSCGRFA